MYQKLLIFGCIRGLFENEIGVLFLRHCVDLLWRQSITILSLQDSKQVYNKNMILLQISRKVAEMTRLNMV